MLKQETTGLILIDVQGKLAKIVNESEKLAVNLEKLIRGCQILSIPIIWAEQNPKGLGSTIPELEKLLIHQKPIEKYSFNAFENETFQKSVLESNKKQWLVCGIEAHICVYQTAMGLLENNFEVEIVTDCVSSRAKESIEIALQKLQNKGAGLTTLEMCLYELVKDSRREIFREILSLIK
ncbi:nicotinamidase-related amidase [Flavobacterium nitrogenifigens]|uniref:Nicotinamidase-related amidase n=2 Tax=Flavobacterium TaxID=237 RepID=A0A7W7N8P1_9FLAO|nr:MULTISPECIES: hydrolase [Flavobacterium]MBB4802651.1 nicotinamidase-related amidase [Flavobacterium nitrogenifigens]MBB6387609.1 nicotinamidase-related amidase [Flavobacterium notoginsengisoli]